MDMQKLKLFFIILTIGIAVLFLCMLPLLMPHPDKPWSNREFWILFIHNRKVEFGLMFVIFLSIILDITNKIYLTKNSNKVS